VILHAGAAPEARLILLGRTLRALCDGYVAVLLPAYLLALGLLFLRSAQSQMDVPTRAAFVMAVVTPQERAAAASFTAVPRSLAAAASPTLGGVLFAAGWLAAPLVACGALKIAYDMALLVSFRSHEGRAGPPFDPEEKVRNTSVVGLGSVP